MVAASSNSPQSSASGPLIIGRYALFEKIASGGMATVYLGRLLGAVGFSRTVAIKRLHGQFAQDPGFAAAFLDEARLAARVRHPNVVPTVDVVAMEGELFLVMEYVEGESLSQLLRACKKADKRPPISVVAAIVSGMLHGLHGAHEARNEAGEPLGIVHRDVSPQNVLVGTDGVPRVLDFGVAKATHQVHQTRSGELKGKIAYMAPEQLLGHALNRRVDIFAAGIVLWEALTCERLFSGDTEGETIKRVLEQVVKPPSATNPTVTPEVDAIVLRALERDPAKRYATALEMAIALEDAVPLATPRKVGEWVHDTVQDRLVQRASKVAVVESSVPNLTEVSEPTPPAFASSATPTVAAVVPARVEPLPKRSSVPVVLLLFGVIAIVGGLGWFYMRGRGTTATVGGAQTATGPAVSIGSAISSAASAALAAGTASATATTSTTTTGPAPTTTTKAAGTGAGTGTGTGTGTSATAKVGAKAGGKVGPKASASADIYSRD